MKIVKFAIFSFVFFAAFFVAQSVSAASVYYSVGQSTADLKTGTPTITVTSGAATFSEAQTGNIGVGDRVTYGQVVISSFADQGNGLVRITTSVASHGFVTGDFISIANTTNYNGTYQLVNAFGGVFDIVHAYTAESGGTTKYAANIAYIASKNTTYIWNLTSPIGTAISNRAGTVTVNSIKHEYTTLNSAITGAKDANHINNTDLTAANVVLNIPCYYDSGADTTQVDVTGYTTGASNYIKIYTPSNTSTEANNSQRHQGRWDEGKYNLTKDANSGVAINVMLRFTRFDGLQVDNGNNIDGASAAIVYNVALPDAVVSNCYLKGGRFENNTFDSGTLKFDYVTIGTTVNKIYNNIIEGPEGTKSYGIYINDYQGDFYLYSNTIVNAAIGINRVEYLTNIYAKNNLISNCTMAAAGTFAAGTDYNATDNSAMGYTVTGSGNTHDKVSQFIAFSDAANKDFHLSPSDTAAKNAGADLSSDANLPVTTDIDGQMRPAGINANDIGADEAATAIYYSVGQNTTSHETGSGTVTVDSTARTVTFTVAQTATNMGVGDLVTYTGGSCYITYKTSTSVWGCQSATGGAPTAVTDADVTSIAHAFASFNLAEAGAPSLLGTSDLVLGNYQLNFPCYYDSGPDTSEFTIYGYNTGVSNYIRVYTPYNTSTEVNQSQRHQGKWDDTKFSVIDNRQWSLEAISVEDDFVRIDGLQVYWSWSGEGGEVGGIGLRPHYPDGNNGGPHEFYVSNSIIKGNHTTTANGRRGIKFNDTHANAIYNIYNNVIYDVYNGIESDWNSYATQRIYNNSIINSQNKGISIGSDSPYKGVVVLKNNIIQQSGSADYDFRVATLISSNNISQDATSPNAGATDCGGHSCRNQTVTFADATNDDYHLSNTDTAARSAGVNLQADLYLHFSQDIDGQERTGFWDIGADQFADGHVGSTGISGSKTTINASQNNKYTNGLVGLWSFDGPDVNMGTNTAYDRSGNGNNGTISGATPTIGKIGAGMGFNGTTSFINAGSAASLDDIETQGGGGMTISAWINPRTMGENNSGIIISKSEVTDITGTWFLRLVSINRQIEFVKSYETQTVNVRSTGNVISLNAWQHVVMTWDGGSNASGVHIYVNGQEVSNDIIQNGIGAKNSDASNDLYIGSSQYMSRTFDGGIDEVRIYNRVFSASEISSLYNTGKVEVRK